MDRFDSAWLFLLGGIALLLVCFGFYDPDSAATGHALPLYSGALLSLSLISGACALLLKRSNPGDSVLLHPPVLLGLWSVVNIGVPGLLAFFDPDKVIELEALIGVDYVAAACGMVMVATGALCLWVGYWLGLRTFGPFRFMTRIETKWSRPALVFALYGVGIGVKLLRIRLDGIAYGSDESSFGSFTQVIECVEAGRYLALAIVAVETFQGNWPRLPLVSMVLIEVLSAVSSGFVGHAGLAIGVVGIAAVQCGVRLKPVLPYVAAFILIGIVIVPIGGDLRVRIGDQDLDTHSPSDVMAALSKGFDSTWGEGFGVGWSLFTQKVFGRQAIVAYAPGVILSQTPDRIPYQGFEQFLAIPASMVPRAIWPDKPVLSTGRWFSTEYLNMPMDTESSSAMTIFGECYIFAGWWGLVAGMLGLGLFFALLYKNTVATGHVVLFVSLTPMIAQAEGQLTTMVVALVQQFAVNVLLCWILSRHWGAHPVTDHPIEEGVNDA